MADYETGFHEAGIRRRPAARPTPRSPSARADTASYPPVAEPTQARKAIPVCRGVSTTRRGGRRNEGGEPTGTNQE